MLILLFILFYTFRSLTRRGHQLFLGVVVWSPCVLARTPGPARSRCPVNALYKWTFVIRKE